MNLFLKRIDLFNMKNMNPIQHVNAAQKLTILHSARAWTGKRLWNSNCPFVRFEQQKRRKDVKERSNCLRCLKVLYCRVRTIMW